MESAQISFLSHHQAFMDSFVAACQADDRVLAAFLSGSYITGTLDAHSDVDLDLVTTDEAHEAFCAEKKAFLNRLGELVFVEDWGTPHVVFFNFADDTEGEMMIGSEGQQALLHRGPHLVLLDKTGILSDVDFPYEDADPIEQIALLESIMNGFWHDVSHFITALARGQLWWAYGQLEALRHMCLQLARLRHNFLDDEVAGHEAFFKIDKVLTDGQLAALQTTYVPMEQGAMLRAVQRIVQFYQENAQALAQAHHISYPIDFEQVMLKRLARFSNAQDG